MSITINQQIINGIYDFISLGTETFLFYMFLKLFMPKRYSSKVYVLAFFIGYTLLTVAYGTMIEVKDILGQIIIEQIFFIFTDFIFCWVLFKLESKKYRYIVYTGLFHILIAFVESLTISAYLTCLTIFSDYLSVLDKYVPATGILIGIIRFIEFAVIVLIKRCLSDYLRNFEWNWLLTIPIISAVFLRIAYPYYWSHNDSKVYPLLLILSIIFAVINVFVFYHIITLQKATEKYIQVRAAIERRHNFTVMTEAYQESAYMMIHNIRDNLTAPLMSLLNRCEFEEAKYLLSHYDERLINLYPVNFTGNADADALLLLKSQEAKKSGVHLCVSGNWPGETGIAPDDLGSLLGCALDNAIEAAQKTEGKEDEKSEKEIKAAFIYNHPRLLFMVSNPYDGKLKLGPLGEILSTKPKNGGLGIKIMKNIAKTYHGDVDIEFDKAVFTVSVTLLMRETANQKDKPKQPAGRL